ncbi:nuclear receptor-interacting protein 1 [Electrophorus electricus]|uniref:Nuclear receptor interacting protein 1b n=1 Tax=Electrophorus electricus TaxID=8005 RepID=A0A4W4F3X9_ELEEL|nr:nuclear receptor-interacting protein 1 [Electrophorus electricus]XP_026877195.2 nuclear receptor-interacting protein 1 [Electrophorus electricus]
MTHGEEPCPETQQDSAVLTYLEGLLMHPVASGPGATATGRLSGAGNSHGEPGGQGTGDVRLPEHGSSPGAASQHLKKARLLRSGAWGEADERKTAAPVVEANGQGGEHGAAAGESTLLASLLQSFSSRLQTVAMSQVTQGHEQLGVEHAEVGPAGQRPFPGYCTASSRLRGLMRRIKQQGHDTAPYGRRDDTGRDHRPDSPPPSRGSPPDAVSCAERLKAVASLVKSRSSPAASPKPSATCSQLALLLSSEAHLQEYSREQALKAQLSGRLASERLAAMATQQSKEHRPPSVGETRIAPDVLSSFNALNGTLPSPTMTCSKRSPSLTPGQGAPAGSSRPVPHPAKEKRPFDRHGGRPPQTCSSLLLLLLDNHNSQKHLTKNGHLDDDYAAPRSRASSHQSDSECSNLENSLTKDSSDVESCYSSCSPIDLSLRSRGFSQKPEEPSSSTSSSLDKLTETLINKWKPETPGPKVPEAMELETSPDEKSHHKVTLMQLLLDHKNNEKVNKVGDNPDLQHDAGLGAMAGGPSKQLSTLAESRTQHPLEQLSTTTLAADTSSTPSPFSYSSPFGQSSPLDLCKSKHYPREKMVESTFSASKLLQNLAQCGLQNPSPSPPLQASRPPSKRQSPELEPDRPQTLLDRLVAPVRNKTPLFEPPPASFAPLGRERSPPASAQIENLLERRTILQLLLGTASHKEKSTGRSSAEAAAGALEKPSGAPVICDSSNGPSPNVRIKTEPAEESFLSDSSDDGGHRRRWGRERHGALAEARGGDKAEGCPADAAAKYGLLSQLLKQQSSTCHSSPGELPVSTVKEETPDFQGPLPKKRRLCLELAEHLSSELCQRPLDTVNERLASGAQEEHGSVRLLSPKEEDSLIKCPARKAPPRESQSFNVLKQLLLSDNCLKELSQSREAANSFLPQGNRKANGNFGPFSCNPEPMNLPWLPQTLNSGPGNLQTLSFPPGNSTLGSPWPEGAPKPSPTNVKRETESSPKWVPGGEGKRESCLHSRPLTRSNPILYYMLQRGSAGLRKGMQDLGQRTHCGVTVKEEPCTDVRYHERRLSTVRSSPTHGGRHSHGGEHLNGSLKKL